MPKYTVEISKEIADFYIHFAEFSDTLEDVLSNMLSVLREVMIAANAKAMI